MCETSIYIVCMCETSIIPTKGVYSFFKNINKYVCVLSLNLTKNLFFEKKKISLKRITNMCSFFKFNQKIIFLKEKKLRQPGFEPSCPKFQLGNHWAM